MYKQPLLLIASSGILGILFQSYFTLDNWVLGSVGAFLLAFYLLLQRKISFHKSVLVTCFFSFIVGALLYAMAQSRSVPNPKNFDEFAFIIERKLNSAGKYRKYEVDVWTKEMRFKALVYLPKTQNDLDYLHIYTSKGYINGIAMEVHDFQFNYAEFLARDHIYHQIFITNELYASPIVDPTFSRKVKQKRWEVLYKINTTSMSRKSQEFLKGIILADRTEMDAETVQAFNRSGLTHFLAISGTHMVVIFLMFYSVFRYVIPVTLRKYAIIVSLIFIWCFGVFIGFGNSVLRSCIMITVYYMYGILQRKPDLLHSLSLSAIIILVLDPRQLFDVGFQMSFVAVLGIYFYYRPLLKLLPKAGNRVAKLLGTTFTISIAAQIAVVPLMLVYFHQYSPISIVANFFIVPLSEVVIVISFIVAAMIGLGGEISSVLHVYDLLIVGLLEVISFFGSIDFLYSSSISWTWIETILLWWSFLFLGIYIRRFQRIMLWKAVCVLLLFLSVRLGLDMYHMTKDEVLFVRTFTDKVVVVKSGNFVQFYVKTTGDFNKVRQYVIDPFLSSRRVSTYDVKIVPNEISKIVVNDKEFLLFENQ